MGKVFEFTSSFLKHLRFKRLIEKDVLIVLQADYRPAGLSCTHLS